MQPRPHLSKLVERARLLPPAAAAVVFPVDADSLQLALSAAFAGYITPVLVGPEPLIREAATRASIDISPFSFDDTPNDPRAAGLRAAALAGEGSVDVLIKGSLGNEDLLAPIARPASGLRTGRRLSHVTFVDAPGLSRGIVVADALLNVRPNLAAKRDIVENTVRFATAIGVVAPRVALLAAKNLVSTTFASTSEAAALRSMASQHAFEDAIVDGPMTPDVALSADAALLHGARSEIAGRADVLIAPTMEAATMVVRTMTGLSGGLAAGLVVGARVPVVTTTPFDPIEVRVASCVLAAITAHASALD